MAKWDMTKEQSENSKKGNNSIYNLSHHGDEIIVRTDGEHIKLAMKFQTGIQEYRSILMSFETQTQLERLLPSIMKGMDSMRYKR